ncbi:MAG: M67 family metallopeptidase [Acidobacteria bacterium]|nr:M67 family metallopeptidase [Acidobacteriota bacterium]
MAGAVVSTIRSHAERESPRECCGLLLGTAREVREAVATANVAAEPARQYQVSPADHFALIARCREASAQGAEPVEIIGVYHSHPRSAPVPSPTDRREALPDFLYIIVGPVGGSEPIALRAYRLIEGEFEEIAVSH